MKRRFINYPTHRLLAVIDDPADALAVADELAAAGFDRGTVSVLDGSDGATRLDGLGASGPLARLLRTVQFMTMDQMPDFAVYERALRVGRTVVAVRAPREAERRRAVAILRRHDAHFVNYYGRFSTEEIALWRGPEPEVPAFLRR